MSPNIFGPILEDCIGGAVRSANVHSRDARAFAATISIVNFETFIKMDYHTLVVEPILPHKEGNYFRIQEFQHLFSLMNFKHVQNAKRPFSPKNRDGVFYKRTILHLYDIQN